VPYQILPNIIFIFSILGILLIILRRLPEASSQVEEASKRPAADQVLVAKGLPAEAFSKLESSFKFWIKKIWHFMLEAKDMRPHATSGYKMKKIFGGKQPVIFKKSYPKPITTHEVRNEQYYLDMIKLQPKNLTNFDSLGKFYLEQDSLQDALDIYLYLTNHESYNPEYHARLAFCYYKTKQYEKAAGEYYKSIELDSTQPNRYYNLGLSLEAMGDLAGALKNFQSALQLENSNSKYHLGLSNVYARLGQHQKAMESRNKAKELEVKAQL
jgi:tetratricopeptide (TPR) repeat protein